MMDIIKKNKHFTIKNNLSFLAEQKTDDQVRTLFNLSVDYRTLAIAHLLGDADRDLFFHNISLSAQMRNELLLKHKGVGGKPSRFLCASHIQPFFDAIAAGQDSIAENIALLSYDHWVEEEEYEEDFYYAHFMYLFIQRVEKEILEKLLVNFERSLQGNDSSHYTMCQALLKKNQDLFESSVIELLVDRSEQFEKMGERMISKSEQYLTEKYIYVEGLALIRIAKSIGLKIRDEYTGCPAIAIV